jgi:hypothetical protein
MAEEPGSKSSWKSKWNFRNIVLAVFVYFGLKGCGAFQFYAPYWGTVVDETGQPVEGAGVIAHYMKECVSPGGPTPGPFGGVQANFTDEEGDFFFWPRFFIRMPEPFCYYKWDPEFYVLKGGYKVAKHTEGYNDAEVWWRAIGSPITFGSIDFYLKELEGTEQDYSEYFFDISNSLDDSEHFWMVGDTAKYVEMAKKEERWANDRKRRLEEAEEAKRRFRRQWWGIE